VNYIGTSPCSLVSIEGRTGMTRFVFRQKVGPPTCPYLIRYTFECKWFSIRLHHWLKSDDLRYAHDHPWDFYSIVLWGNLTERTENGDKQRKTLSCTFFSADYKHSVVIDKPCWTLLFTGPTRRVWGYWVNGKFRKRNKYFHEHGHHDPCE
jgi:hypothetical protein